MIAAVLSDLDGVLVDSAAVVHRAWRAWARRHALPEQELLDTVHGRPSAEVIAQFAPQADVAKEAAWIEAIEVADTAGLRALPGAAELLRAPARLAVVTSGTRPLATARLKATGLPVPDVLVTADRITRGKPHPEPYLTAAAELGVEPRECLVVEDAPAGVAAGLAAGMTVIALTTTHAREQLAEAHAIVPDARAVLRWLSS